MRRKTQKRESWRDQVKPVRVANENHGLLTKIVAPWAAVDRWPALLGSNLSLAYLASVLRFAINGYRQQLVDALDELLERDPHTQAVLSQRVFSVSSARIEVTPAHVADPEGKGRKRAERAKEIAEDCQRRIDAIPGRTAAIFGLEFSSLYYGAGALELRWKKAEDGWSITGLGFVHSRRIAWPDQNDWSAHIWDQGAVMPLTIGLYPTENFFGLRIRDFPGKFIFHTPQLRGDYPTRDGLGRVVGWFQVIKLMAVRGASQYVERFGKPWVIGNYSTVEKDSGGEPRAANEADIAVGMTALEALGVGSLATAMLPDSIKVTLDGPGVKGSTGSINHEKLIDLCDAQISKVVRGGTLQTDAGEKGARSLGEVHATGDVRNARYDGQCLADVLKTDLVWWLARLNYPGEDDLYPGVMMHVEQVEPAEQIERAEKLAKLGAPVDGKALAKAAGVALIDPEDEFPVRLAGPLKPVDLFALDPQAGNSTLAGMIDGLATRVGVALPPAVKSAIAEMEPDDAARLIQTLIGGAKELVKDTSAAGAGQEGGGAAGPKPGDEASTDAVETDGAEADDAGAAKAPKKKQNGASNGAAAKTKAAAPAAED